MPDFGSLCTKTVLSRSRYALCLFMLVQSC